MSRAPPGSKTSLQIWIWSPASPGGGVLCRVEWINITNTTQGCAGCVVWCYALAMRQILSVWVEASVLRSVSLVPRQCPLGSNGKVTCHAVSLNLCPPRPRYIWVIMLIRLSISPTCALSYCRVSCLGLDLLRGVYPSYCVCLACWQQLVIPLCS